MKKLIAALYPTEAEMLKLARRETDPRLRLKFEPITLGPVVALAGLILIGLAVVILTPFRFYRAFSK